MTFDTLAARARRNLSAALDALALVEDFATPATLAALRDAADAARADLTAARHGAKVFGVAIVPADIAEAFALRPVPRTSAADLFADLATARDADAFAMGVR
jgi:hypothetical protein